MDDPLLVEAGQQIAAVQLHAVAEPLQVGSRGPRRVGSANLLEGALELLGIEPIGGTGCEGEIIGCHRQEPLRVAHL